MPNRRLTEQEIKEIAAPLLDKVRQKIENAAENDETLLWALRRYIKIRLEHDERGKPIERRALKKKKRKEQGGRCPICQGLLPEKGAVLDRLEAMGGYSAENTRLLCPSCDQQIQRERGYQ